jgi:hypothetical protein
VSTASAQLPARDSQPAYIVVDECRHLVSDPLETARCTLALLRDPGVPQYHPTPTHVTAVTLIQIYTFIDRFQWFFKLRSSLLLSISLFFCFVFLPKSKIDLPGMRNTISFTSYKIGS